MAVYSSMDERIGASDVDIGAIFREGNAAGQFQSSDKVIAVPPHSRDTNPTLSIGNHRHRQPARCNCGRWKPLLTFAAILDGRINGATAGQLYSASINL